MDTNSQERIDQLERTVANLQVKLESLSAISSQPTSLNRYLDNQSKDIIEDVVGDRIANIVWNEYFYYFSTFESIERCLTTAGGSLQIVNENGLVLQVNAASFAETDMRLDVASGILNMDRETKVRTKIKMDTVANGLATFYTLGDTSSQNFLGFEIRAGTINGITDKAGVSTTVAIGTASNNTFYDLELHYYPRNKVVFFVNGIEKGTSTTNLPVVTATPLRIFEAHGGRLSGTDTRTATFSYFELIQKK